MGILSLEKMNHLAIVEARSSVLLVIRNLTKIPKLSSMINGTRTAHRFVGLVWDSIV